MTSLGWMLVAHVVAIDTWIRLMAPAAAHPVAALLVLALALVAARLIVMAASHLAGFDAAVSPLAQWARPTLPDIPAAPARLRTLLVGGNGPRAPGRTLRRPSIVACAA